MVKTCKWLPLKLWSKYLTLMLEILTSMGLTGVEGKGCRYSGCRMCPDRAVSIFKSLMGTRCACRAGSDGGAEWRKGLPTPLFRELLLCQAAQWSLFFRADADGVVIMSQLSAKETARLSSDTLRKSKKHRALLFKKKKRIAKRSNNPSREGARRGSWKEAVRGYRRSAAAPLAVSAAPGVRLCAGPRSVLPIYELVENFTSKAAELVRD